MVAHGVQPRRSAAGVAGGELKHGNRTFPHDRPGVVVCKLESKGAGWRNTGGNWDFGGGGLEAPEGNGLEARWTHWLEASVTGKLTKYYYGRIAGMRPRAALIVFEISIAIVMGPTPPGTGVIARQRGATASKSTSPVRR